MTNQKEEERFALIPSVYLMLRQEDKVLLLRRANTGYMDGHYSLVAGHVEADEPARVALSREAKEEAGVIVKPEELRLIHTGHRYNRSRIDLIFVANTWQGEIVNAEPGKCDDLSWYPLGQLPEDVVPYVRFLLEAIAEGTIYSEYFEEA